MQSHVIDSIKAGLLEGGYDVTPGQNAFTVLKNGEELFNISVYPSGEPEIEIIDVTGDPLPQKS